MATIYNFIQAYFVVHLLKTSSLSLMEIVKKVTKA